MSLMLHCGGLPATFEELCSVEVPPATDTYRPVPHGDLVRLVEEEMTTRFRLPKPERSFGLNREGQQMFGVLKYNLAESQHDVDLSAFLGDLKPSIGAFRKYGLSIGLRNAYDYSMRVGIAGGTSCFVCDNLSFHGSCFTVMRKHTPKVWDDLVPMVMTNVKDMAAQYIKVVSFQENMKRHLVRVNEGYEIIGLARGTGVLTPSQSNVVFDEWQTLQKQAKLMEQGEPVTHAFAADHDSAYGLYQSFTHGLKLGHIGRKIDQYTGASHLFEDLGLSTEVEDAELVH